MSAVASEAELVSPEHTPVDVSVVLPAHDEAASLEALFARLAEVLSSVAESWEIIVVDDGSTDETWACLSRIAAGDPRIRGLRLSRNFGHQVALSAGLGAARGRAVITMDADLQHPPELIPELMAKGREGCDVVYAVRDEDDAEGWLKVHTAHVFYWLLNKLTGLDLPTGAADYRYMSRPVVDALQTMPERNRFLRGMTRWVGFDQATVTYRRGPRESGASKYTVRRMIGFALDAMASFSSLPLRLASWLGTVVSLLGMLYACYVLLNWAFSDTAIPGWTSVIITVLILGGAQLACLGIVGQYLGRVYDETKGRPLFLIRDDTRTAARRAAGDQRPGSPPE